MDYQIIYDGTFNEKTMGHVFHDTLVELMKEDPAIYEVEADLASAGKTIDLVKLFPDRAFDTGIQEANMVGMCAGISLMGRIPYCHTFAAFMSRRVVDQIFMTIGYNNLGIHAWGSDEGICSRFNGGTHGALEDISCWRPIAGSVVLDLSDSVQFANIIRKVKSIKAPVYMRSDRAATFNIYQEGSEFEIGKSAVVRDGKDVTILACGIEVVEAIKAATTLEARGISTKIVDMYSIKPIDEDQIKKCAEETGAIVVAENHNANGGLGDAVANVLARQCPVPMEHVAVFEQYSQVGDLAYLLKVYGLDAETISRKVEQVITRKQSG